MFTKDKCEEVLIAGHVAASVFILDFPRVSSEHVNGNISIGEASMWN